MKFVAAALFVFFQLPGPELPEAPTRIAEDNKGRVFISVQEGEGREVYSWNGKRIEPALPAVVSAGLEVRTDGRRERRLTPQGIQFPGRLLDQHGNYWHLRDAGGEQVQLTELVYVGPADPEADVPHVAVATGRYDRLLTDDLGYVWMAGDDGILCFDPRNPEAKFTSPQQVSALALSPFGTAMAAYPDGGLYELMPEKPDRVGRRRLQIKGLPDATPVDGMMSVSDGTIWIVTGGKVFRGRPTGGAWQRRWEPLPHLPFGNHGIRAATLGRDLYVVGGRANHGYPAEPAFFDEILRYSSQESDWYMEGRLGTARAYSGLAALDGNLWIVGGAVEREGKTVPTKDVTIFDPATGETGPGPDLTRPRHGPVLVRAEERLYAIGGADKAGRALGSVESIGPNENHWTPEPGAPVRIRHSSGCELGGKIYTFMGPDNFLRYDPQKEQWVELPLPAGTQIPQAALCAAHNGKVWLMGGFGTGNPRATLLFDPANNDWDPGPSLPTPLAWGAAASVEGQLILAGGTYYSRTVDQYIFSDRAYRLRP